MADPTFYQEGNEPRRLDTQLRVQQKILGAIRDGGGGGGGAYNPNTADNLYGSGSPEGVVTATPGQHYEDVDTGTIYWKQTGSGNTGWI